MTLLEFFQHIVKYHGTALKLGSSLSIFELFIFQMIHLTRFLQRFIKICYEGRKNFADIWSLAPVPVMYIEVKIGFKTFFQRDLLEKPHILLFSVLDFSLLCIV